MSSKFDRTLDAIFGGDLLAVQRLVVTKKDACMEGVRNGVACFPLIAAAACGKLEIAEFLLEKGADVNQKSKADGETALCAAAVNGHAAVARLLMRFNADLDLADNENVTPLFAAAQQGHVKVVRLLCEAEANVNKAKNDGASPLYTACQKGHYHCARVLIKYGADVNQTAPGLRNVSPLIIASFIGRVECIRLLINGADSYHTNDVNYTALDAVCVHSDADKSQAPAIRSLLLAARTCSQCQSTTKRVRQCNCGYRRYCSLECQRSHWKADDQPHKAECKTVRQCGACGRRALPADMDNHCGACRLVYYCNRQCQSDDWPEHKKDCKSKPKEEVNE